MIRLHLTIVYLLLLSLSGMSASFDSLFFYPQTLRFGLGTDIEAGIGKTRDRTLFQPWNFCGSAQLALEFRLFSDYALMIRGGYAYFKDEPALINFRDDEAFRAELKVHESMASLSQITRPFSFLWLEQGLLLVFPFRTQYDVYVSHLSADGWTDYAPYSTEKLDRTFYDSYPLLEIIYGFGLDISRLWQGSIPLSIFFRQELGLSNMYLSSDLFAATGREQNRLCWGLRTMIFNGGKTTSPTSTLHSSGKKHNVELSMGIGGGFGNLRSVQEDPRFHQEEMAHGSIKASYVYNSRFRLGVEIGDQFRQYTESEFNLNRKSPTIYDPVSSSWIYNFSKDYFHHYLNYFSTCFWLDAFPVPYVVSGMGIGLYWMLPFGDYGWKYVESDSTGEMTRERVYHPHESYSYSFDPALLFKLGTPLYRFTKVPLELDLLLQWGLRTPEIRIGFYRETRPTFASISLGITYVFEMLN